MNRAIVLLAHGARDPEWARPIEAMAGRLRQQLQDTAVQTAYLEFMRPDLDAAVSALVAEGATSVTVVPVFLAQGGHVKRDLPQKVGALRARLQPAHPAFIIELLPAIGEQPEVIDAIATSIARLAGKP